MTRPPYQLAIFDFDGTLADTFPWFCSVINAVARQFSFREIAEDETHRLRGMSARAIIAELGVPVWKLPLITRHMHRLASRDIAHIALFPGIREMIETLDAAGIALAIVSSNTEDNVRHVLGAEAPRFRHYACGASMFGKARRLSRLTRAARVSSGILYVGDELRDLDAAREAGIDFGAVAWGYTRADALARAEPTFLFQGWRDIARALCPPNIK